MATYTLKAEVHFYFPAYEDGCVCPGGQAIEIEIVFETPAEALEKLLSLCNRPGGGYYRSGDKRWVTKYRILRFWHHPVVTKEGEPFEVTPWMGTVSPTDRDWNDVIFPLRDSCAELDRMGAICAA